MTDEISNIAVDLKRSQNFHARPIHKIRHQNLVAVLNERFDGNSAALARAVGIDPTIISRYVGNRATDSSNIGDTNANKIEKALLLAPGWLDADHELANRSGHDQAVDGQLLGSALSAALLAQDSPPSPVDCARIARVAVVLYAAYVRGETLSPDTILALTKIAQTS